MAIQVNASKLTYMFLSETTVPQEVSNKRFEIINEATADGGGGEIIRSLNFNMVMQSGSTPEITVLNRNGRDYDLSVILHGMDNQPNFQHELKMGTMKGEYGHPDLTIIPNPKEKMTRQLTIDPKFECVRINKYWQEGNLIIGNFDTMPGGESSWGETLRKRILMNHKPMASARALGRTDAKGKVIPSTYYYITTDVVNQPGHTEAYGLMDTVKQNNLLLAAPGHTMNECVCEFDARSEEIKEFILSESVTKNVLEVLCGALQFDYHSMSLNETGMSLQKVSPDGMSVKTVHVDMKDLINMEMHKIF